jgi:hypothetical protein
MLRSDPEQPCTMYGVGLHQQQSVAPAVGQPGQQNKQAACVRLEFGTLDLAGGDDRLLAKQSVLGNQLRP